MMHLFAKIQIQIFSFILIAPITLIYAAALAVQPFKFVEGLTKGQSATVLCAVLDGTGPFVFRWSKDGSPLVSQPLTKVQSSEEFSLLNLRALDRSRSGNYTCTITNEYGQGNYTAELFVYEQPEWTFTSEDVAVVSGQSARIECKASGVPEPVISWKKIQGDQKSSVSSKGGKSLVNSSTLILSNIQEEDDGIYQCSANNGIGEIIKKSITVVVNVPPHFRDEYQLMKVRSSHSAALQCEVTGERPLAVKWSAEFQKEAIESRHKIQETPLPNGLLSELFITRVSKSDAGLYTCTATNPYGQRERTIKLVVLEPPSPPSEIVVKQIGSDEVTIRWSAPYSGNSPVTRYILQYWKDTGAPPKLEEKVEPSQKASAVLVGLHPGTPYVVRLVAENEFGQSTPSIPVKFMTSEERPSGYPTDISVTQKGPYALLVRWKPPSPEQRNGMIRGYDLGYRNRRTSEPFAYQEVTAADPNGNGFHEYLLDKLQPNTEYEVVIRAYNGAGKGPLSIPVSSNTREKGFLAAPSLWVESVSSATISLRWSTNGRKHKDLEYKLYYRVEDGSWDEITLSDVNQDSYVLKGLQGNMHYEIFLQSFSPSEGRSNPSATVKVSTADPSSLRSSMSREENDESTVSADGGMTATMVISLSVVTSAVVIVCVVASACVYVVRIRTRAQYKTEEMGSRHLTEQQRSASESTRMSANFRYVDVNSRPLLWCSTPAPPPANDYPSPYATLPLRTTPLSKRWQSEGDGGLNEAPSERSESLVNQRVEQNEEKAPSSHD